VDAVADIRVGGHLSAGGLMRLHAGQTLDIVGGVSAGALDLVAGRAVFGGDVMVAGDGAIVAGSLVLPAGVEAGGSLRIDTAGDLVSTGWVVANGDLSLGGRAPCPCRKRCRWPGRGDGPGGALSITSPFVAGRAVQLAGRDGVGTGVVQSGAIWASPAVAVR
jgi:hypothetical protein